MTRTQPLHILFSILGAIILLFIVAPLISMVLASSGSDLFELAEDQEVLSSIWLTIRVSMLSALLFSIGAIPLAYLLARKKFMLKNVVLGIINLPVVIPHTAAGIALLGFLSRDSTIGKLASHIGIDFIGHPAGIGVAMAFVSVPFLINAAYDGFSNIPERLEKSAMNLGASSFKAFFTISLPLCLKHIISGITMMFARGMSEFGAVVIIAYHPMTAPVLIYERFNDFGLQYARPVAIIFILISLIFFILLRFISKGKVNVRT